jgi:flagellar hook-associated protein 1 FlgK
MIKASTDVINENVKEYRKGLDLFTTQLMDKVNAVHRSGFSKNGSTGMDFFVGNGSKTISINPILKSDISNIATSAFLGIEGNTDIAKGIANVIYDEVGGGMDFRNYVNGFSMGMAQDLNTTRAQISVQGQVLEGIMEQKESTQGVNLEEEMSNLMMFQRMFSANAKSIKVIDEVNDALLQII